MPKPKKSEKKSQPEVVEDLNKSGEYDAPNIAPSTAVTAVEETPVVPQAECWCASSRDGGFLKSFAEKNKRRHFSVRCDDCGKVIFKQ